MLDSTAKGWLGASWHAGAAALVVLLNACSSGEDGVEPIVPVGAGECTALGAGDIATLDAEVHVIAGEGGLGSSWVSLPRLLLPDGGDVYWYDADFSVLVERQSDGRVVELQRAEPPSETQQEVGLGLAANAERLFVGYGKRPGQIVDYDYEPLARLLSISKQDGQSEVLLQLDQQWLAPLWADAERVIVFVGDGIERSSGEGIYDIGFYQVPLAAPRLEPLPLLRTSTPSTGSAERSEAWDPLHGQLLDDQMYWVSNGYPRHLLRAGFDDSVPLEVMRVPDDLSFFSAGPGYILTKKEARSGNQYAGQSFLVRDDSGCHAVQGPHYDFVNGTALESEFAYWAGGAAGGPDAVRDGVGVTRIDLTTGALTRLNLLGFTPSDNLQLIGHDDTRLFLYDGGTLLSLRKP